MKEFIELVKVKEIEFAEFGETCSPLMVQFLDHTRNCHEISDLFSAAIGAFNSFGLKAIYQHLTTTFANKVSYLMFVLE